MVLRNDDPLRTSAEVWRDRLLAAAAAVVLGLTLSNVAPADEVSKETKRTSKAQYEATMDKAKAEYKVAQQRCQSMTGNEKDVCRQEAKADHARAEADAKAMNKSNRAGADANEEKREAEFKVARAKCDSMTGNSKDVCEKEADAMYKH